MREERGIVGTECCFFFKEPLVVFHGLLLLVIPTFVLFYESGRSSAVNRLGLDAPDGITSSIPKRRRNFFYQTATPPHS